MKTVDELVAEWTGEEREKLKYLIKECQEREKELIENRRTRRENLTKLNESLISLFSDLSQLKERTSNLADDLSGIYLKYYNKKIPWS
ncbi:MAG: hypothetical protein FJ117_14135 [Deltaproteobacteria bacterium]|nr:hypothetical protein [Deltaproteobacteria bacterium]